MVRHSRRLDKRDKVHYTICSNGEVVMSRAEDSATDDPVLGQFLGFLPHDIAEHPERLQALDANFVQHLRSQTAGLEVDLDAPLLAQDE